MMRLQTGSWGALQNSARCHLKDDIHVENTKVHFIYANKMGEKYLKRYKKYFRDPDIREFNMQHEQWLFGGEQYTAPVLKVIDEFMEMAAVE